MTDRFQIGDQVAVMVVCDAEAHLEFLEKAAEGTIVAESPLCADECMYTVATDSHGTLQTVPFGMVQTETLKGTAK